MKLTQYRFPIFRPHELNAEIAANADRCTEITASAFERLNVSEPDTFLGKQHYPIIPLPYEDA